MDKSVVTCFTKSQPILGKKQEQWCTAKHWHGIDAKLGVTTPLESDLGAGRDHDSWTATQHSKQAEGCWKQPAKL